MRFGEGSALPYGRGSLARSAIATARIGGPTVLSSNTRRLCGDGLAVDGDVVELEAFHVLRDGGLRRAGEGAVLDADVADQRVLEAAQGPRVGALLHVQVEDFDIADDGCERALFA